MWEIAVHLAIASGVYNGVFFPRDVLDGILDLNESVSEDSPTYFSLQSYSIRLYCQSEI